ncbi:hypothetical protein UFRH6_105 [Pseudomonas phage UF_RH6]|nr:hypothetical protein UFRH6_105 [Pseudomonas phage UF_RH6]
MNNLRERIRTVVNRYRDASSRPDVIVLLAEAAVEIDSLTDIIAAYAEKEVQALARAKDKEESK